MKKAYKYLPMIVFIAFIGVMFVLYLILPKNTFSSSEKRYLAQAPELNGSALFSGEFREDFEDYVADQTPGRDFWVGLASYYNYALGNNGEKGVYLGKNGYLINDPETMTYLSRNAGYIEAFAAQMKKKGIPTAVLTAPSTGYICADQLPAVHKEYRDDEVFDELQKTFKAADFVDIREAFQSAYANGDQVYYRTDHHWTTRGAYTAYRALSESLGYTPTAESVFAKTAYPGFYGSTYSTSGYFLTAPDEIEVWDAPDNEIKVTITDGETTVHQDMFFNNRLKEDDKYTVFLDGNHPYTVIQNKNASSREKLLVVKDSFAHSLVPFLADHYAEIVMVDMRYYSQPLLPIVEKEGIDRVLFLYSIDNLGTDTNIGFIE